MLLKKCHRFNASTLNPKSVEKTFIKLAESDFVTQPAKLSNFTLHWRANLGVELAEDLIILILKL
jgi:hypothetical protein